MFFFPFISRQIFFPFDDQATFINLTLLITFTLALVQALLSLIGSVIAFLWSPCCLYTSVAYKPIPTNSHYAQTSPHRYVVYNKIFDFCIYCLFFFVLKAPQTSTMRSMKRPPVPPTPETHRFINDSTMNSYVHKMSSLRGGRYDEV